MAITAWPIARTITITIMIMIMTTIMTAIITKAKAASTFAIIASTARTWRSRASVVTVPAHATLAALARAGATRR